MRVLGKNLLVHDIEDLCRMNHGQYIRTYSPGQVLMSNSPVEGGYVKLVKGFISIFQLFSTSLCFFTNSLLLYYSQEHSSKWHDELVSKSHGKPGIEIGMEEKPERWKQL